MAEKSGLRETELVDLLAGGRHYMDGFADRIGVGDPQRFALVVALE